MATALALTVLGLPFASFAAIALVRPLRRAGRLAGWVSIGAIACAFLAALAVWRSPVRRSVSMIANTITVTTPPA